MATPYLGEIRPFSFTFAPKGWALCNGQTLPINQNQALFALIGTFYGGDGQTTFALPDLRGRSAAHSGGDEEYTVGEVLGEETVTLLNAEMPTHNHQAFASSASAGTTNPAGNLWASNGHAAWSTAAPDTAMAPGGTTIAGGSQPHENRSPFLVVTFCIALAGVFPSRN